MRIFVAGKAGEEESARKVMQALIDAGHEITFDWTSIPHLKPYDQHHTESREAAILESRGLLEADAVVLLAHENGVGMYVELGMAIATKKPVYVIGSEQSRTMFLHHPVVQRTRDIRELLHVIEVTENQTTKS
jgi:nucleoside 2-deoxyribosyltransferase